MSDRSYENKMNVVKEVLKSELRRQEVKGKDMITVDIENAAKLHSFKIFN